MSYLLKIDNTRPDHQRLEYTTLDDNEIIQTIKDRRSIRDYDTSRDIPDDLIYKIIEAGGFAPSAEGGWICT